VAAVPPQFVTAAAEPDRAGTFTRASPSGRTASPQQTNDAIDLTLLGAFALHSEGERVELPTSAQRLLAFLALHTHSLLRVYVAGNLWIDVPEERAHASLRSTLWRLNQPKLRLVETTNRELRLAREVRVDFRTGTELAHRLLRGTFDPRDLDADWEPLAGSLLPDWYDDWVLLERERYRQLGLHALEMLSEHLTAARRFGPALEAALAAVAGEPFRESAHRVLIKAHLAEGNASEAIRQYDFYRKLVNDHLGLDPSPAMDALLEGLTIR
jgi:DNA-binding SARP family transcriptional activator